MKNFLLIGVFAFAFSLQASADLKVALIDTGKAFDAYYKTKDMATKIAAKKASFEKDLEGVEEEYQDAQQEAAQLDSAAKNPANSPDVRKSKDAALAQKVQDLQSLDQEIETMRRTRSQEIQDELVRSHQEITDSMMAVITAYFSTLDYDLVLDKTPVSNSLMERFPYKSWRVVDLTQEVIAKLNASAPPSAPAPAATH
jgi:Skp family chaperone for outer membrane proteins